MTGTSSPSTCSKSRERRRTRNGRFARCIQAQAAAETSRNPVATGYSGLGPNAQAATYTTRPSARTNRPRRVSGSPGLAGGCLGREHQARGRTRPQPRLAALARGGGGGGERIGRGGSVVLPVSLLDAWVASTKPGAALVRSQGWPPWQGRGWALA